MKLLKNGLLALVGIVIMFSLTACAYEVNVDLSDISIPVVSQINYFTEDELKADTGAAQRSIALEKYEAGEIAYEQIWESYLTGYEKGEYSTKLNREKATVEDLMKVIYPDSGFTVEGKLKEMYPDKELESVGGGLYKFETKLIKSTENNSRYSYINADNGEEVFLESPIINASSQKVEMFFFDNYKTNFSSKQSDLSSNYDSYTMNAKLPFKVYYTNGKKTSKKGVSFDKSFAKGEERCVAVASKKIYNVKKITTKLEQVEYDLEKGEYKIKSEKTVKNGKTYTAEVGCRLTVKSKNAIKVFSITANEGKNENSGKSIYNIAENSYTFDEPGTYKIKIVLANDTTQNFKIKIK